MTKKCSTCKLIKNTNEFYPRSDRKSGLRSQCKFCLRKPQRIYAKKKCDTNPMFKLAKNLRIGIIKALKLNSKSGKTMDLLGCSIEHLKQHLEVQFTNKMNWNNQGKWEVDHITPVSSFDLKDIKNQKKCFHYTNLQPLWKKDNLIKSNKIII